MKASKTRQGTLSGESKLKWDVIVVGGGASGLMAAGRAAEMGARVLLLEKMDRVGLKLGLTGKGRCNLTHAGDLPSIVEGYCHNGRFLFNALSRFSNEDLVSFFHARGLPTEEERGQRIFPRSNRASDVVRVLQRYATRSGLRIQLQSPVREVLGVHGRVTGVRTDREVLEADRVVLATGGASYPQTGSSGDGYMMAARLGHSIRPIRPALVPLEVRESWIPELQGLSLRNVRVKILRGEDCIAEDFGEMLFTHFGVSGPVILTLSSLAGEWIGRERIELAIDFKPALTEEQLEKRWFREVQQRGRQTVRRILTSLLPQRIVPVFLRRLEISPALRGADMRTAERKCLLQLLKDFRLGVRRTRPIAEAIVTAGGVSVAEIDPYTMESRLISGLYFCGEIIDVDGRSGGYNLQAAFSTGRMAGDAAGRR